MWMNYSGADDKQLGQSPSPQTHGHNVDLNVSFNPQTSKVVCHLQPSAKSGTKLAPVLLEEPANQIKEVSVTVSGGKGAPGKRGEDGMPGQNGWDGVDATQYSPGTDGANGGRGTDGKPGTSGGNGGDGGDVNIRVSDADTDLLALLRVSNPGGAGGEPGAHGKGGDGGLPGRGGRPHSWTTSYQVAVQKTRWEEYRVYEPNNPAAVGGMVTRSDQVYYTDYETRYQQHHQPGGRDGHRGAPGATPTTPLSPGRPGRNGGLAIHVHTTG